MLMVILSQTLKRIIFLLRKVQRLDRRNLSLRKLKNLDIVHIVEKNLLIINIEISIVHKNVLIKLMAVNVLMY